MTSVSSRRPAFAISGAAFQPRSMTARVASTASRDGALSSASTDRHNSRNSPAAVSVTVKPAASAT